MLLNLRILLSACIALNFTSSAAVLSHPFDNVVFGSNSNAAGGRGRSNHAQDKATDQTTRHSSPSSRRRRITVLRAKKGNNATAAQIMAVQLMRMEQLDDDESTVAPSVAPSEADSFTTTTFTTIDTTAITNGGVDADNNDITMTGSTMAEEVSNNNNDKGTNTVSAANLTISMRSNAPSLSPPMNSSWETSSNATTNYYSSVTTLGEGENKEGDANINTPSPSPTSSSTLSPFGGVDDESEGTEELGEPLIRDGSNVPTPSMGDHTNSDNWNDDFENYNYTNDSNNDDDYDKASFAPTPSDVYFVNENDDFYAAEESIWEETFTPPPTVIYVPPPTDEDPLIQEEAKESGGVNQGVSSNVGDQGNDTENKNDDDNVLYHGLGGTVGTYMDGIESPTEMEKDKNIQIVTGTLLSLFVVALLITAHLVMHHPDGLCAGCCRLALGVIGCAGRTLCLPCRALCCSGSEQSRNRRSHAPIRTPFPTDLELT